MSVTFSPDAVYTFTAPLPFQFVSMLWSVGKSQSFATKLIEPLPLAAIGPGGIEPVTVANSRPSVAEVPPVQALSGFVT